MTEYLEDESLYYDKVEELDEAKKLIKQLASSLDNCFYFAYDALSKKEIEAYSKLTHEGRELTELE